MSRRQSGFTLIELMIALVLFSFVIAGVLAVAVSMSQGFREQRAAIGAESAVRVPLEFLIDALRQVSPGAPSGNIQDVDITPCPAANVFTVTNNQTSMTGGYTGWDKVELIYASGAFVTAVRNVYDVGTTAITVDDASGLQIGDYIIISNTGQGTFVKITNKAGNNLTLATQCTGGQPLTIPTGGYPAGALVIRAQHAIFTIDDVDGIPTLMMDPDAGGPAVAEPLAEGIEDLQIAMGIDQNGNGQLSEVGLAASDDEWQGNFVGDAAIVGVVRAARVTMIARTTSGTNGNSLLFNRPGSEDHATGVTFDKFRRRVLRSMVEIRNMGGSP